MESSLHSLLHEALHAEDSHIRTQAATKLHELIFNRYYNSLLAFLKTSYSLDAKTNPDARDLVSKTIMNFMEKVVRRTWDFDKHKTEQHRENAISHFMYLTAEGLAMNVYRARERKKCASDLTLIDCEDEEPDNIEETWPDPNSESLILNSIAEKEYMALVESALPKMVPKYVDIVVLYIVYQGDPPDERIREVMVLHDIRTKGDWNTAKHRAYKRLESLLDPLHKLRNMGKD